MLGRGLGLPYPHLQWVWPSYPSQFHPGDYDIGKYILTGISVYSLKKRKLVTSLINVELKSVTIDSINAYQGIKKF